MGDDLLSDLPHGITESILMRMPIRDAVRTSVLSSKWRYRWTKIPRLVFDDTMLDADKHHEEVELENIEKFITHTLLLHKGPIHTFQLSVSPLRSCADIDQWVLYLSRNGIRELTLDLCEGEWWRVHSCLFSCKKLTYLELRHCELFPPNTFKGFMYLQSLILNDMVIPTDVTEFLISSCPLLETLSLTFIDNFELHIDAPKLKYLTLEGEFKDIILVNTPLLETADICMYLNDELIEHAEMNHCSPTDRFLGAMPLIRRLTGHVYFTKFLSVAHNFRRFPITFKHLKILKFYQVSFEDLKEVHVVLQMLVSSPVLHTFSVSISPNLHGDILDIVNWDKEQNIAGKKLENMRHVKITNLLDSPLQLQFVQFILERSPVLEALNIQTSTSLKPEREKMLIDLLRFRRASTLAEIVILPEPQHEVIFL